MVSIFVRVIVLSSVIFVLVGVYDILYRVEPNGCVMTYMWPNYIRMDQCGSALLADQTRHSKYSLYLYREGRSLGVPFTHEFDGIPILFIPGNSGSYRQVRSVASESARTSNRYDFWSLDFQDEFSAFSGRVMEDQLDYVHTVIVALLERYPKSSDVILMGHSMGGILAKLMMNHPKLVRTVITIATPHSPVILPDQKMRNVYSSAASVVPPQGSLLVSICGGWRDRLVSSHLCMSVDSVVEHQGRVISVLSSAVPGVLVELDHQCSVWCNQLVKRIVRALHQNRGSWRTLFLGNAAQRLIAPRTLAQSSSIKNHTSVLELPYIPLTSALSRHQQVIVCKDAPCWMKKDDGTLIDGRDILVNSSVSVFPKEGIVGVYTRGKAWLGTVGRDVMRLEISGPSVVTLPSVGTVLIKGVSLVKDSAIIVRVDEPTNFFYILDEAVDGFGLAQIHTDYVGWCGLSLRKNVNRIIGFLAASTGVVLAVQSWFGISFSPAVDMCISYQPHIFALLWKPTLFFGIHLSLALLYLIYVFVSPCVMIFTFLGGKSRMVLLFLAGVLVAIHPCLALLALMIGLPRHLVASSLIALIPQILHLLVWVRQLQEIGFYWHPTEFLSWHTMAHLLGAFYLRIHSHLHLEKRRRSKSTAIRILVVSVATAMLGIHGDVWIVSLALMSMSCLWVA